MFKSNLDKDKKQQYLDKAIDGVKGSLQKVKALHNPENILQATQQLVSILDQLVKGEEWNSSIFLQASKKRFAALRDEAKDLLSDIENEGVAANSQYAELLPESCIRVYILLYQSDGADLNGWKTMLRNLVKYNVTRPIYTEEAHAKELIRSRAEMPRYGYAIVKVNKEDIIPSDAPLLDNFSHKLLMLKEGAVEVNNIQEFVHANVKHYLWRNNELIDKDQNNIDN